MMNCKNCGAPLEEDAGYCSYCGARIIDERISTRFLMQELLDKVLSVDNKLLKTFLHLFTKPHAVINDYINGIRKRYYNPFSYLLISLTLSGIYVYFLKDAMLETLETVDPNASNPMMNNEFNKNFINLFSDYQAFFTVSNIPIYAFMSWLVFLNRKMYNFYEHLIIYLYAASHTAIISSLVVVPSYYIDRDSVALVSVILAGVTLIYFSFVLIKLYKLTFVQFVIKSLYFTVVSTFVFLAMGILMNLVMFLYYGPAYFKQFMPKQPPKDSIQKVEKPLDSIQLLKLNDSLKTIQKQDSIQKDVKTISYYEASSRLNCLS
jgi:hypothetical protein